MSEIAAKSMSSFKSAFDAACRKRSRWEVWYNWIEMYAISISNTVDLQHREARETEYAKLVTKYDADELQYFPEMFHAIVSALQADPNQDFLGTMYMELELYDKEHAQIFTPLPLCEAMTDMTLDLDTIRAAISKKGYASLYDPTCGAGATLISARNELQKLGYGTDQIFFVGQDLIRHTALTCYLQLSLLGCAGVIAIGDTLTNPIRFEGLMPIEEPDVEVWMLPGTYTPAWASRYKFQRMQNILKMLESTPIPENRGKTRFPAYRAKKQQREQQQEPKEEKGTLDTGTNTFGQISMF